MEILLAFHLGKAARQSRLGQRHQIFKPHQVNSNDSIRWITCIQTAQPG